MKNVIVDIDHGKIEIKQQNCWMYRGDNTIALIKESFRRVKHLVKKRAQMSISLEDHNDPNMFSTCGPIEKLDSLVPCWSFYNWKECGVNDYDTTCKKIMTSGQYSPMYNKIFWIGNANTNPIRGKLLKINDQSKFFEFIDSGHWIGDGKTSKNYVSLSDHTKYRFLLDVCGNGYSARLKFLLFSNRVVFHQIRDSNEYWFYDMEPFKHYIPIQHDLSDLCEKIEWIDKNGRIANKIAKEALMFAEKNLTQIQAIKKYSYIILSL
jgi:hypothetical protein